MDDLSRLNFGQHIGTGYAICHSIIATVVVLPVEVVPHHKVL
jgi:hypothetical protein